MTSPQTMTMGEVAATPSAWNARRLFWMLALVAWPMVLLDQASKFLITTHLALYQEITLIPNFLAITYTLNPGAAFSLFATMQPIVRDGILSGLSLAAIILLMVLLLRGRQPGAVSLAYALILGGAAGNLFDRIAYGRVIDFIFVHYYAWTYPVFNLADSAITIGAAIILIHAIFFDRRSA